jgi:CubicO group peptidase (beta-lactamase class C family)
MTGGVGGHAGLFSNAWDVGTFAQMLLEGGRFLGGNFLQEKIIIDFSKKQFSGNRRALAWDKPRPGRSKPVPASVSPESYGHKGFTGTYLWIDPKEELVYVFLCNRIYPSSKNWKLQKLGIREQIHALLYEAILD